MVGHTSGPDLESLLEDFTPATALEFGLDTDFLNSYPELLNDLDQMEWEAYGPSMVEDNAPETSQQPIEIDDKDPKEMPFDPEFVASAVQQPKNDPLPVFPYELSEEVAPTHDASAQKPNSILQDSLDPADLLKGDVEDVTNVFGTSDVPSYDLNRSFAGAFELPDNSQSLNFLQNLHLVGDKLAGGSELDPKTEDRGRSTDALGVSMGHQGTKRRHYMPKKAYTPLIQAPKTWDIFQYTKDGELDPSRIFTADEINRYLFNHPLHRGYHSSRESQLKLRIHRTPAASAKRFPNGLWCRFRDCPMRTIGQGQYLVIVDELSVQYPHHDPFLNAAYMHLWCMERYCNFEVICANLNVSAKCRDARLEEGRKNRFCLGTEEEKVVEDWVEACRADRKHQFGGKPWVTTACPDQPNGCPHYDSPSVEYRGTLCHQLTVTKLHSGGQGRINLRIGREDRAGYKGANITRHLGDLNKETELREFSRCHKNQNQLKPNPKTERHYRTDGEGSNEEEQVHNKDEHDDGQTSDDDMVQAPKKPKFKLPIWDEDRQNCASCTPEVSPHTMLTPKPQWTHQKLQMTAAGPDMNRRITRTNNLHLTRPEDESEGEIELEIIAAQRRRRLLEIEDAKDREKECRLRKLKLQKSSTKKRCREGGSDDGDDDDDELGLDAREKRRRVKY